MTETPPPPDSRVPLNTGFVILTAFRMALGITLLGVALFTSAGSWDWPMAWAYLAMSAIVMLGTFVLLLKYDPALLVERSRMQPGTKWWDKLIVPVVAIILPLITLVVAGLDRRWGWDPDIPIALQVTALIVILPGYGLLLWSMLANTFFSATVRIQSERGHRTVTGGPYRYVRHPGYSGATIAYVALPVALGSVWALIPAIAVVAVLMLRTVLEDNTLKSELDGYAAYAERVRWRLVPGLW